MIILKNINCIDKILLIVKINKYLRQNVKKRRRIHSWQVAKLAKKLCLQYNEDPWKGMIAGLTHDIAREFDSTTIEYYAHKDGIPFSEIEIQNPIILHGRAAAVFLKEEFGITDAWVLAAVRDHIVGRPEMPILSKIIFVADFLEPKRGFIPEQERRILLTLPLDVMLLKVLEMTFYFLKRDSYQIAAESIAMYSQVKESIEIGKKI
jgi:predicted HD superfamily hydrolase involved in NAD metabolism